MPTDATPDENEPPFSEADERQMCLTCLAPNELSRHFCANCGAPMTVWATTGPFEHIFAEGYAYRRAVEQPRKLTVVLGIWLLFGANVPASLVGIVMSWNERATNLPMIALCIFMLATSSVILWRTTQNYRAWRRKGPAEGGEATETLTKCCLTPFSRDPLFPPPKA